jgi:hypothetical protein
MKKPTLNKWEWTFDHQYDFMSMDRAWNFVRFGIYKFHNFPKEGETFSKKDYKGFMIQFYYWFPIRFK